MSDVETFYCLIVGSRSFSDYELFVAKCDLLLRNWGSVVIVSGGARGADGMPWIGDIAIWSSLLTGIRTAGVRGISGIVRCTNIFPPMKTAVLSRFGTERVVEPARAFRLPDRTPTRLGLSMCL